MSFIHNSIKIKAQGRPNSTIRLRWAPTFEWYMVRCVSKHGHHKDMC